MAPWFLVGKEKNWENLAHTNRKEGARRKEFTGNQQYLAGGTIYKSICYFLIMINSEIIRYAREC